MIAGRSLRVFGEFSAANGGQDSLSGARLPIASSGRQTKNPTKYVEKGSKIAMRAHRHFWLKKTVVLVLALVGCGVLALSEQGAPRVHGKISPGPPLGFTGAPGEGNCTGCHYTFALNSGGGKVEISGLPASYTPGQSYTVTVTLTHPTARAWGFELTALDASGTSATVGALTVTNSTTVLKRDSNASGKLRTYLSHNDETGIAKGKTGSNSWSFSWTAPAASAGDITFYAVGNAANNQISPEDDYIYTNSVVVKSSANPNRAPVFETLPERFLGIGDKLGLTVSVSDPDNQPLTVTASTLTNATFDAASKRLTFTPTANQLGQQQITFTASDGQLQTQQTLRVQVLNESSPALTGLSKPSAPAKYLDSVNATQIELTVQGTFGTGATLLFNGLPLTTQTVANGVFAVVPGSELSAPGAFPVRVRLPNNTLTNARLLALAATINAQPATTVEAAGYGAAGAAGQLVALFGTDLVRGNGVAVASGLPLPRALQGTSVLVNGVAAPLFFVAGSQINYQIPYSTATGAATVVILREDGVAAYGAVNVNAAAAALFSADASGKGQAAAQNSDFSRNGDPAVNPQTKRARKGDFVVLYGSGVGAQLLNANTNQALAVKDGEAASSNPLAVTASMPVVTIGGKAATVYFSGLAPGFVSLWQLNVQVPPDAPRGSAVEVVVSYGGQTANRLTIAIE